LVLSVKSTVFRSQCWNKAKTRLTGDRGIQSILSESSMKVYELENIFSMAKIKVQDTEPDYLFEKMARITWDRWIGDMPDGRECNKIGCEYDIGGDDVTLRITYTFCFGRTENPSDNVTYKTPSLSFCALVARYNGEWLAKQFTESDLENVIGTVKDEDQWAVSTLGLVPVKIQNPLNFITARRLVMAKMGKQIYKGHSLEEGARAITVDLREFEKDEVYHRVADEVFAEYDRKARKGETYS